MDDIRADLTELVRLTSGPLRSDDAAPALGIDVAAVEDVGEDLVAEGVLGFSEGGFVSGPGVDQMGVSEVRRTRLAVALAEALTARGGDPGEIGNLYAAAGRWENARDRLAEAALRSGLDPAAAAHLAALGLQAEKHAPGLSRVAQGRLRLVRARHLRATGRSHEAMEELDVAVRWLHGAERVDALGFTTVVADDLQAPQWAETLAALGEYEAWSAGEPAKAASMLTLRGRMLSRMGFPREADRVLEIGLSLLEEHGHEAQRFYARLNRARVQLDRGEARSAEAGFARLREDAKEIEGPVSQADKEVYWARAAFAAGRPAEAVDAVERAEAAAVENDAPVLSFLAAIARAEGALCFERHEEALEAADRVLELALAHLPAWENRARALRARALVGLGRPDVATSEVAAALASTPEGVDGLRLRKEIEVIRLLALPPEAPWPKVDAEDLTDELLQAQWHLPALELMIERAERENDAELALHAAGLAIDLGIPTRAIRAAHVADLWSDPAGQAVAYAAQTVAHHLPESWKEDWTGLPHVAAALAVEVADDEVAVEALTAQWAQAVETAGLAGEVLSPAQRRIRGLVRRRAVTSWARRLVTVAGVVVVAAVVSVLVFVMLRSPPPDGTTTTSGPAAIVALEDTKIDVPEDLKPISGVTTYRGDPGRSGVLPGTGVSAAEGYYWRYTGASAAIVGSPVTYGKWVFVGSVDSSVHAIDMTTGRRLWQKRARGGVLATPAVAELRSEAGRAEAPPVVVIAYGSDSGEITFREAIQRPFNVIHAEFAGVGQAVIGTPLAMGNRFVVATAGPDSGRVLGISPLAKSLDWTFPLDEVECEQVTEAVPECDPLGPIVGSPAAADGIVYVATSEIGTGYLYGIHPVSGMQLCRSGPIGPFEVNPVVADGVVYALNTSGQLYAFATPSCSDSAPNRNVLYYDVSGAGAAPAIIGDLLVIPVDTGVLFIDLATDEDLQIFDSGAPVRSAPVVADGKVYFGNDDGVVFALDLETRDELWRWQAGGAVESSVSVLDGVVIVTSTDATVTAIGGS